MSQAPLPDLRRAGLALGVLAVTAGVSAHLTPTRPLLGVLLGAVAADQIATRSGAAHEIDAPGLLRGALLGLGAALATAAIGSLAGQARWLLWGLDLPGAGMALLGAGAVAVRDELALRWTPSRLLAPHGPAWLPWLLGPALGVAAASGAHGPRPSALALAAALGLLSTALQQRSGSVAASIGVGVALRLLTNPTPLGVEVRWSSGSPSPLEAASGPGAWLLAASLLAAAALAWRSPLFAPRGDAP